MILRFALYNAEEEIGKKFLTMDNITDVRSVYVDVPVNLEYKTEDDLKTDEIRSLTFDFPTPGNEAIYNPNRETGFGETHKFLKLEFRNKRSEYYTDFTYYTDHEVYMCNDDGQTVQKFKQL
jgi:hypothetical protein